MKKRRRRQVAGRCPCGSGKLYGKCCGPLVEGQESARTAVELMRSRYTAYARGDVDYIVETTDREGRAWKEPQEKWRREIGEFSRGFVFGGVEILEAREKGDRGEVVFLARLEQGGEDASFRERSDFRRHQGRWLYVGGDTEPAE